MNSQSLPPHIHELRIIAHQLNPKIIAVTETHVTQEICDVEICIEGYNMIRCNSDSRHTGGVIVYMKRSIQFTVISNMSFDRNWMLAIKIVSGYNKCIIGVLYRSPNNNVNNFLEFLEDWYEQIIDLKLDNLIVGDFNIDISNKKNKKGLELKNLGNLFGLKQMVNDKSRVTRTSETLIDLVFTNNKKITADVIDNVKISDHSTIHVYYPINEQMKSNKKELVNITCWKNYSKDK